jgi:ribosome recycling factor
VVLNRLVKVFKTFTPPRRSKMKNIERAEKENIRKVQKDVRMKRDRQAKCRNLIY